ncbi:GDSL-type esterase/lipase family protein [Streptomyces sp. RFCAC02]|uniref:GDSL-type esterase/lipase family protein n=1 Tax=Streptomyces sp. RFCAC02 TaxID=2499143 RepID=UPI00101F4AC0|nr:GDSL-type esterase/lipase family protein [Streptomyces sp. RFCAC02]
MGATERRTGGGRRRGLLAGTVAVLAGAITAVCGIAAPGQAAAADDDGVTVYLAGDSTVQTYDPYWAPQAGWGQMLDRYFSDEVTVANHAIGGRSSRSFVEQGRLDAILDEIQPGDYLFVQFGHNDASVGIPERYTSPADYKEFLRDDYIGGARERGAIPVIVTPVSRRSFDATTGLFDVSFPEYVRAATEVAAEEYVPLVDLSAASRAYLDSIGPEEAESVFLHVPAGVYPNRPTGTMDDTHFQEYGAIQMARLVAGEVAGLDVPLADRVVDVEPPRHAPRKPHGLAAGDVSNVGLRLTWRQVRGADIYRVQKRLAGDPAAEWTLATTSTIPLADVTGLTEGTAYELRVVAVNAAGDSKPSKPLAVTTRVPDARFDFGPAGAPVAAGCTEVTRGTLYADGAGYGFVDTTGMIDRDRGAALGDLDRDFVAFFGGRYEFLADVPNGTYSVTVHVGDLLGTARSSFAVEGVEVGGASAGRGVTTQTFNGIEVTDGRLDVAVYGTTAHLNGLDITRVG